MTSRFFACGLAWLSLNIAGAAEMARPKVLIIGIDGCRPDALQKAKAPHLHELIRGGAFSDKAQTGERTVSGPGWSSMLTGVWDDKHGVRDNKFEGANYKDFPHFFRRLKQAQPKAVTMSIVNWVPINDRVILDTDFAASAKRDADVAAHAAKALRERDPDAIFVHFDEVDGAGHKHGFHPKVAPYMKAIEQADVHVGTVLSAMRGRRTYGQENWLVLVSTDHGGNGKGHGKNTPQERTIFVIVSGPAAAAGVIEPPPAIVDIAATALVHLGVPIDKKWKWDGKAVGLKALTK